MLVIRIIGNMTSAYSTLSPIIKRSNFLRLCNVGANEHLGKLSVIIMKDQFFKSTEISFKEWLTLWNLISKDIFESEYLQNNVRNFTILDWNPTSANIAARVNIAEIAYTS